MNAQNNLAFIYSEGVLVPQNLCEAYKWSALAAEQGFAGAAKDCDEFSSKMTGDELSDARRRAATFKQSLKERSEPPDACRLWRVLAAAGDIEAQMMLNAYDRNLGRQPIPSDVRREFWRRDEGKCVKCGSRLKLEYDHIIPVAKGGGNTARNIELLCESCNRSKSASIQ
jgi:hypothetical protein